MPQINFVGIEEQAKGLRHYSFLLHWSLHSEDLLKTAREAGSKRASRKEKTTKNL